MFLRYQMVHQQVDSECGPFPIGLHSSGLLTRLNTPLDMRRADIAGFVVSPNAKGQSQTMANANVLQRKRLTVHESS